MPVVLLLMFVILIGIALIPVGIVQRYRRGSTRQRARGWLATLNIAGFGLSAMLFLTSAAITTIWVPHAFVFTAGGLASFHIRLERFVRVIGFHQRVDARPELTDARDRVRLEDEREQAGDVGHGETLAFQIALGRHTRNRPRIA